MALSTTSVSAIRKTLTHCLWVEAQQTLLVRGFDGQGFTSVLLTNVWHNLTDVNNVHWASLADASLGSWKKTALQIECSSICNQQSVELYICSRQAHLLWRRPSQELFASILEIILIPEAELVMTCMHHRRCVCSFVCRAELCPHNSDAEAWWNDMLTHRKIHAFPGSASACSILGLGQLASSNLT